MCQPDDATQSINKQKKKTMTSLSLSLSYVTYLSHNVLAMNNWVLTTEELKQHDTKGINITLICQLVSQKVLRINIPLCPKIPTKLSISNHFTINIAYIGRKHFCESLTSKLCVGKENNFGRLENVTCRNNGHKHSID